MLSNELYKKINLLPEHIIELIIDFCPEKKKNITHGHGLYLCYLFYL